MKKYKLIDNITGLIVFIIAATTYLLTIEPTASFWDCGEFIAAAHKFEVGHPPGAPFFMLTAKFFTLFAPSVEYVAMMVNSMSAIFSALTILFLFWSITHLAKKLFAKNKNNVTLSETIAIMSAGAIGALAYTFSDTFWFSAAEGEVYAYSSLFTALVFWAILKWEECDDQGNADRWIIFIAYLTGLSIGVHLLNLLAIPAIVLVYYFKKYIPTTKGTIGAIGLSGIIIGLILYGMVPGVVNMAGKFDLFFVNTLGLKFNTGILAYVFLVMVSLIWTLFETHHHNKIRTNIAFLISFILLGIPLIGDSLIIELIVITIVSSILFFKKEISRRLLNTTTLSMLVIFIGYLTYTVIYLRSDANLPMDQNSPRDPFALASYLNREQYGDRPLLYGEVYNTPRKLKVEGNMCIPELKEYGENWIRKIKTSPDEKDQYISSGKKTKVLYEEDFKLLLPRMWSTDPGHIEAYKSWGEIKGKRKRYNECGELIDIYQPTFFENMRYMINYQINYMYWRYFMWNFSGRQNDIQGHGESCYGNWITGFDTIDSILLGADQSNLPDSMKNNKGHNTYFMLPLLLGLIGLFYQINENGSKKHQDKEGLHQFLYVFMLFFMTGLAIVLYLNQTPYQPRERDYAYAGSFYAFCIWIGLGVLGIIKLLEKGYSIVTKDKEFSSKTKVTIAIIGLLVTLPIPIRMATENWDDHDRSGRYTCRDLGYNYLISCEPNAIIFTYGDNDTFPLWYLQEVEGVRTDVRVCNLSYLSTDWYISQMKRASYDSKPLPISWDEIKYAGENRAYAFVRDKLSTMNAEDAMNFLLSDEDWTKKYNNSSEKRNYIPSKNLYLNINKEEVAKNFSKSLSIDSVMKFTIPKSVLYRSDLMILEMIKENNKNNWNRPIYFAVTVPSDNYLGMDNFFSLEGMAYRLTPSLNPNDAEERIDCERMYDNMVNKFRWGGIENPDVYLDENVLKMVLSHRQMFSYLINGLIVESEEMKKKGDDIKAKELTDKAYHALSYSNQVIPLDIIGYDISSTQLGAAYYFLDKKEEGTAYLTKIADKICQKMDWYITSASDNYILSSIRDYAKELYMLRSICSLFQEFDPATLENYDSKFKTYMAIYDRISK